MGTATNKASVSKITVASSRSRQGICWACIEIPPLTYCERDMVVIPRKNFQAPVGIFGGGYSPIQLSFYDGESTSTLRYSHHRSIIIFGLDKVACRIH